MRYAATGNDQNDRWLGEDSSYFVAISRNHRTMEPLLCQKAHISSRSIAFSKQRRIHEDQTSSVTEELPLCWVTISVFHSNAVVLPQAPLNFGRIAIMLVSPLHIFRYSVTVSP